MGFSISIDWQNYLEKGWDNIGRSILFSSCKHKDGANQKDYCSECDISEDSAEPMMNYGYPLETEPDEKDILKVVKETNCTIMKNDDGDYFLALSGGGMDLSQDIAYSYLILENWIPKDLIMEVSKQPLLSVESKKYKVLARAIIKQLKSNSDNFRSRAKEWRASLKSLREQERLKKVAEK